VYGAVGYQPLEHQRIAELVNSGAIFQEVPLGEGEVDFDAYFAALQESGYGGI
jgi:L-ribulose-5-phosphate 3-epimerase